MMQSPEPLMRTLSIVLLATACVPELEGTGEGPYVWTEPNNSWPVAAPPDDLVGEGFFAGQVPHDFRLLDQHGDEVSLWQFYGSVVVVDISTMWCAPCRDLAQTTEETYQGYLADGLMYLTILPENVENQPPSNEDLNLWADQFGITAPVVADPQADWASGAVTNGQYPVVLVLDRSMRVAERVNPPDDPTLHAAIDRVLSE